jgi:hypothetical protein
VIKRNTAATRLAATMNLGKPVPAIDLTGYTDVVILLTVTIAGHEFRRGSTHTVDTPTLEALKAAGAIQV